jgi:hypothetical protein
MAFTVDDFQDLLRLLEQRPEWRAELRRYVLTDDLVELPSLVRALAEAQARTEQRVEELAQAQRGTEQRMGELAAAVESLVSRVGPLHGDALELRYWRRAAAYFSPLARKLRVVDSSDLAEMLDEAVDAGHLTGAERDAILAADLVLSGQRREDRTDAYFVVEISVGIGVADVTRAAERASLLAKLGRPAVPVVAGEWINSEAIDAARSYQVWQVLDGRTSPPAEA